MHASNHVLIKIGLIFLSLTFILHVNHYHRTRLRWGIEPGGDLNLIGVIIKVNVMNKKLNNYIIISIGQSKDGR